MTDHSAAAVDTALQIEAKKHALRQQQDGCWILTMKVHQNDMPSEIMKAPMGARYVVALVEIGDDEQPINRKGGDATDNGPAVLERSQPSSAASETRSATQPRPAQRPAGADKPKSPAQVAGYLCTSPAFQAFLQEEYSEDWAATRELFSLGAPPQDIAAECVRLCCGVASRRNILPDNRSWQKMLGDYRAWERKPEVVG